MDIGEEIQAWSVGAEEPLFHVLARRGYYRSHPDAMPLLANGMVQVHPRIRTKYRATADGQQVWRLVEPGKSRRADEEPEEV
jgi:hypothetical protein